MPRTALERLTRLAPALGARFFDRPARRVGPGLPTRWLRPNWGALEGRPLGLAAAILGVVTAALGLVILPCVAVAAGLEAMIVVPIAALLTALGLAAALFEMDRLRGHAAFYRVFYEQGADLFVHHDREGRALSVSPGCQTLLGHSGKSLLGHTLHGTVHPGDWPELELLLAEMRRGDPIPHDGPRSVDMRLRHRDGGYRWVEMRAAPLRAGLAQRGSAGFIATVHCIEARKRREAMLEQARDGAEAASLAKTRFLSSVSHELRTPLNAIIGFSEVMCVQMFGPLGARRYQEYADYIHESGRHLLDLINDILDMSKIEAGRYDLMMETVRMPLVIEKCLKTTAYSARQAGLKLDVDIDPAVPDLQADARAMRQVLLNLLSNAIKFTGSGGKICVSLRREGDWLELSVADTGVGIPEDALGRLGRPFEQVHQAGGARPALPEDADGPRAGLPGTGLGLAIVKALVSLHAGTLIIDSEEGVGTTVRVLLPVSPAPSDFDREDEDLFSLMEDGPEALPGDARQAA